MERRRHPTAVSCAWYPAPPAFPAALSLLEPCLKVALPFVGFFDELLPWSPLWDGTVMNHEPIHAFQHCVMYASVLWSGLVDLACLRHDAHVPRGLDGLTLAAGFAAQAFVLVFHLTGPALDIRLHALLVVASFGAAAAIAVAVQLPHSELAAFARCVALLTLGSFWIQVGDLMFCRPSFDTNEGVAIAPTGARVRAPCALARSFKHAAQLQARSSDSSARAWLTPRLRLQSLSSTCSPGASPLWPASCLHLAVPCAPMRRLTRMWSALGSRLPGSAARRHLTEGTRPVFCFLLYTCHTLHSRAS